VEALARHLLRGPYSSTLPRKLKPSLGGCCGTDCSQAFINDLGFLARKRGDELGFQLLAGGGLSTLRRSAITVEDFVPQAELLEAADAVVRVFHRIGNRHNRAKARLKWAIRARFSEANDAGTLKDGDFATIRCRGKGLLGNQVQLESCALETDKNETPIPVTADQLCADFKKSKDDALIKYEGRPLLVSGSIIPLRRMTTRRLRRCRVASGDKRCPASSRDPRPSDLDPLRSDLIVAFIPDVSRSAPERLDPVGERGVLWHDVGERCVL